MVTRAIDGSAARVGAGKVSLCSDLFGDSPTSVRGDIFIKRVHCVSNVLVSGVCVRKELFILHYYNCHIDRLDTMYVLAFVERPCSLGREGKPDFRE